MIWLSLNPDYFMHNSSVREGSNSNYPVGGGEEITWPDVLNIGTGKFIDGEGLLTAESECGIKNYEKSLDYEKKMTSARDFGVNIEVL